MAFNDTDTVEEIWKPIPEFEGLYEASSLGRIRTVRVLSLSIDSHGYPVVVLCKGNKSIRTLVHRLVAKAFFGIPVNNTQQVNHKNFIKSDNRRDNLEWVTPRENIKHARDAGRFKINVRKSKIPPKPKCLTNNPYRGDRSKFAKITEQDVKEIRRLLGEDKLLPREIGALFGIARSQVVRIGNRTRWAHVE